MSLKKNFKIYSTGILFYPTMFTLRRASYVMIALIEFPSTCVFNISLLICVSVFYWSWLGHMKPFESRKELVVEIFNELTIIYLCYHLFCFTDLTTLDAQLRPIMQSFLFSIALMLAVNLLSMVNEIYRELRIAYYKRRF